MTKKEQLETERRVFDIYSGILVNNLKFRSGPATFPEYAFSCPEYRTLREKYGLDGLAGKGSAFQRARRLLHHFAPRLDHSPYYDNHVPCDALSLLEYSCERPDQGINCLNKSKILTECCLAAGICARRVGMMPYSPYDNDNHVVTEIYDPELGKWIMLDPTTDGYCVDGDGVPLSLLELRERFAHRKFATFAASTDRKGDLRRLRDKNMELNTYYCKNLFWFSVDRYNGFGFKGEWLSFVPDGYDLKYNRIAMVEYRLGVLPEMGLSPEETQKHQQMFQDSLARFRAAPEEPCYDISVLSAPPAGRDAQR